MNMTNIRESTWRRKAGKNLSEVRFDTTNKSWSNTLFIWPTLMHLIRMLIFDGNKEVHDLSVKVADNYKGFNAERQSKDGEHGTEYRKVYCRHLLNELLPLLAHRVVSTRSRPRSCKPERAINLDTFINCMFLGKDRELRTECREVQVVTCSSSCVDKRWASFL